MEPKSESMRKVLDYPEHDLPSVRVTTNHQIPTDINSMKRLIEEHVNAVRQECENYMEWAFDEIAYWKDRSEELELELMLMENSFEEVNDPQRGPLQIKRRTNFT